MSSTIRDFFVGIGFRADDASRTRAERSVAAFEKAVVTAEARVTKAQVDGAKASVQLGLQKEAARAREALEAARAAQKIVESEEKKAKAQAQAAKMSASHSEAFVRGMTAMTLAAGTLGIAVTAAVLKVSRAFDTLYFTSQRTGASVSNIKGLQYAFGQVGSTGASATTAIESFSRAMRTNPGVGGFVRSLGVATQAGGKARDTLDVLSDAIDKITTKHPYYTGAQMAELLGLDESQFETFNRYRKEIKEYRAEYEASLKAVGLNSQEASKQSADLQRILSQIGMQVGVAGQALLSKLLPVLERLATVVARITTDSAPALGVVITKIGDAAQAAAPLISQLGAVFGNFGDRIASLSNVFSTIWAILKKIDEWLYLSTIYKFVDKLGTLILSGRFGLGGLIQDSLIGKAQAAVGPGESGPPGTVPKDDRSLWQKIAPKALGGRDAPRAGDGSRSWRNNNPGNLRAGPYASSMGASGKDDAGFAKFPDYATGRRAQEALLFESRGYKDLTIGQAIARWAPGSDGNDPASYAAQMAQAVGASVDTKLSDLTSEQRGRFLDAQQRKEGWIAGAAPGTVTGTGKQLAGDIAPVNGVGGVLQRQGGGIRRQDITEALRNQIHAASVASGVNAEIYSGGQDESGPNRTGSHRHDHGRSADLKLFTLGPNGEKRYLTMNRDGDRALMEKFIRESVAAGANGVGSGPGYMGEHGIHVGGGSPSAWGAGGSSANAPDWVARAHREGMADRARLRTQAATKSSIALPRLPNLNIAPGAADVGKATAGQPMGASTITTTTNNAGASVTMQPQTTVHIHGGDPASNAQQFERSANRVNASALRNVQTALR